VYCVDVQVVVEDEDEAEQRIMWPTKVGNLVEFSWGEPFWF
jgi:hypothetical protein